MQQHYPLYQESTSNDNNRQFELPIIQGQIRQPQIIVNQPAPVISYSIDPEIFKTTSIVIQCPFCRTVVNTNVKKSANFLSGVLCCLSGILFYSLIQYCRNKNFICCDAVHTCPKCGQKIGEYSSL